MSGPGTYLLDFTNNMNWLATGGRAGGRTETYRGTNDVDSTRTAIVTNINGGSGTVSRSAGGVAFIEGTIATGAVVNPVTAGGKVTAVAAVDTRHVEHSVSTSTIRWQSTDSTGYIQQTLHMPEIHGTIPAGMSAYQGAGGVSVQLPAGSNVRAAIEQLSKEPGKEYLKELGNRSDIDWQRVEVLNKTLDFSKSGLTKEAAIMVAIVVSIVTYGAASEAGWGVVLAAGASSLASTAAVSLINNQGDIGATLKELGSKENLKGLLLTMATAGLTQGVLQSIPVDGGTLADVTAKSGIELLFAKQVVQGLTSAVLESAVLGTSLEDALKNNLQGALINTVAAKGANQIGDAKLNGTSKAIAHALLGCAVGAANAGNRSGCAPGAAGGAIGEIVAGLYADASGYDDLKSRANAPGADPALKQQLAVVTNTMTELAKLSGAGAALLIGGDASTAQIAMNTAQNAAVNNRQLHAIEAELIKSNARRFAQSLFGVVNPTSAQELAAETLITNTAQAALDNNLGNAVPSSRQASAFLDHLKIEYAQATGSVNIPGTAGQPGGQQQLFYASVEQKNMPWLNLGMADSTITGLIIKTPIALPKPNEALPANRDKMTGLPLDDRGRYEVSVVLDGKGFTPKYFSCSTTDCLKSASNLDMSDAGTQAYVRALDAQVFKDISKRVNIGTLLIPGGPTAQVLGATGLAASAGSAVTDSDGTTEILKAISQMTFQQFMQKVLFHSSNAAARAAALIDLGGGWDKFVNRVKIDFLSMDSPQK